MDTKDIIEQKAAELASATLVQLDLYRKREDFYGLYSDIVTLLYQKEDGNEALLYEYAATLEKEQGFTSPASAYEAGRRSTKAACASGFITFLSECYLTPENQVVLTRRDRLFEVLCGLLGDSWGLVTEFTELCRACRGFGTEQSSYFFEMGFAERMVADA